MLDIAKRAAALDERDPLSHTAVGLAYSLQGGHESAIAALRMAVELNPSDAKAYDGLGIALARAGRYEEAIEAVETAMRLNPHAPSLGPPLNLKTYCLVVLKRYEEAVEFARRAILAFDARTLGVVSDTSPGDTPATPFWPYAHLASALGHLGQTGEARAALDEMLLRKPDFSRDFFMQVRQPAYPSDWDIWFEGLQKAGWKG